ncbi:serine-rich adhesin for platelets isoform X2 [Toxorhynchites rutilus septentrionalis]|uniref:serine-rich adhesin for platelets isoform X2 n=1 Tax=Toxorhynchites rutilus septentrionalis TaxID=329112 RepID=UPI00247A1B21|nr:serine-rich adhesin for platelets isoform X2 [Toxorhynchites rutilus septentrionalis]
MSKDPSQSRIPRIGNSSSISSRIPIPGSIRPPQFQSRLAKPTLVQPAAIFATPVSSHLRPPRVAATTIARSYSGDKLCGEPFPVLAASTPGPISFYSKLQLASTESLNDFQQRDTFSAGSSKGPVVDYSDGDRMLVDESLELVGAGSTDNLADPDLGLTMLRAASSNETITLNSDGNVTYEVRRSGTFVASSLESLKLGGSRESLNRTREKDSSLLTEKSGADSPGLNKTHILDMDVQDSTRVLNSTMVTNKALNNTHILDMDVQDSTRVLDSSMTTNRLVNVTQNIPNITKELEAGSGAGLPHIRSDSLLYHTHEVNSPDRLLPAEPVAQRPTRLTFNLNETTELLHFSDSPAALNRTHVFSSTMHSPRAAGSSTDALNVTRDIEGPSLIDAMHLSSLPLDTSCGETTLVAEDFVLPESKPSDEMDVDESGAGKEIFDLSLDEPVSAGKDDVVLRPLEGRCSIAAKQRYSFGLDLTECTLDCSIELCDSSLSSNKPPIKSPVSNSLTKQGSFEMDESLGILTPDQMKEFLDSTTTNTNNTNNLELQLNAGSHKHGLHQCRIDQTPSPEELPLDPVGVKTDMSDIILPSEIHSNAGPMMYQEISQTDSDSKTDQMTKSATSKVSNSFITSITSITSLDTGYQGDGEMSRPASRGADHSPSNGPRIKNQGGGPAALAAAWNAQPAVAPVPRRQDPMTDSDFFTESDADDVFNRGDRRAQIIDGQLYGPMMQGANVFINQQPQNDDSCMESSGIFTDVDNRGDDDLVHRRSENDELAEPECRVEAVGQQAATQSDMSPDTSTDTISSSNTACSQKKLVLVDEQAVGTNCLHDASMVSSINTNASSPVQLADKLFSSDCETPDSHHRCDVTKHVVTPVFGPTVATQNQSSSSPSLTTTLVNGRLSDSSGGGVGNVSVECATSLASRGVSNTSTDSLSGASVGSGSISSVSNGKKLNSTRKQQKNETNLVLKKHEMKSCSTRLFKDSVVSSSRSVGGSVLNLNGGGGECENQENRRPTNDNHHRGIGGGGGGYARGGFGGVSGGSVGNLSFIKKSATPNKWDAVMNKIAENKAAVAKRNFSDVKSKISCGKTVAASLSCRVDSPASLKSPPSECNSIGSGSRSVGAAPKSVGGKRFVSGSMKRRTHSKDSQRSSQSDLSLTSVAAKLQSKASSTRPAKKRDVRTINSSSSDLGPPSKTLGGSQHGQPHQQQPQPQTPFQRVNLRTPSTLQKRISPNVTNTPASIVPEQLKGSPPLKRNLVAKRVLSVNNNNNNNNHTSVTPTPAHVVKTPLRDHNRLVGPTPTAKQQQTGANSPKSQTKALIRSSNQHVTTAPNAGQNNHTTISSNNNNNSSSLKNATNLQRNGTIILEKSAPSLVRGADGLASPTTAAVIVHPKQQQQSLDNCDDKLCDRTILLAANAAVAKTTIATTPNNHNLVDISLLNHANRGVEALGVLVQYLVFNLDAFSCPLIKKSHQKTTRDLLDTKSMLDEEHQTCQSLKQQIHETTEREAKLQELHRCEISKAEANLSEQQRSAADRITALEAELLRKELDADMKLRNRTEEFESKLAERDAQLKQFKAREVDLLQRVSDLSCTENELREKVHSSELEFSERLQAATMRERDLTEQLKHLNRQMEEMRRVNEARERELQEKISLTQDECSFLRHSRNSSEPPQGSSSPQEQFQRSSLNGDHTLMGNRSSSNLSHAQILQDEVDSLRYVLDLKQREVSDLRKITQEYERDAKELPAALVKISALESRIEDLQVQIKTKTEEEKELQHKMKLLQDNLKQETKVKSRLSQHNEELQWKLKQNSEKFSHVYAELSKSYHENSSILNTTRTSLEQTVNTAYHHNNTLNHSRSSCSERVFDMDDLSPPTSPVIKGVVEKSDSVSWVLEMDDEPPEITASRMVRRAGSFRSSFSGANQDMKRHKGSVHSNSFNGTSGIQQSSSASSIQKQHDTSSAKTASPGTPRLRSNSVNVKSTDPPKKIARSNSGASSSAVSKPIRMAEMPLSWKEPPLYSSSPYAHRRFLNERMESGGGGNKTFASQRETKDFFLEETESISDMGGDSPYSRSRAGSFSAGPSDQASERSAVEFFHRDKTPNFKKSKENRGLITCDTKALTGAGNDVPALKKRREFAHKNLAGKNSSIPKEAAGEALVSGSNSDDEASSSSCLSDDLSSGRSSSSGASSSTSTTSGSSSSHSSRSGADGREALVVLEEDGELQSHCSTMDDGRRRSSNISLGDALMQKIVASLNGGLSGKGNETPMEVSWSEDGDPSESVV